MDESHDMLYAALCKHFGYFPGKRASPELLGISRQLQTEWEEATAGSIAPSVEAGLFAARTFACASIDARRCARPCPFRLSSGLLLY